MNGQRTEGKNGRILPPARSSRRMNVLFRLKHNQGQGSEVFPQDTEQRTPRVVWPNPAFTTTLQIACFQCFLCVDTRDMRYLSHDTSCTLLLPPSPQPLPHPSPPKSQTTVRTHSTARSKQQQVPPRGRTRRKDGGRRTQTRRKMAFRGNYRKRKRAKKNKKKEEASRQRHPATTGIHKR